MTQQAALDFYFDFSSPYGYFGAQRIDALAADAGRAVHWHPILLGAIFKVTGAAPLPLVPLKGDYAYRDFERTARFHGIAYRRPPVFPLATQAAARAMLWVGNQHGAARAKQFAQAVYHAYFVDGVDISHLDALAQIADAAGLQAAPLIDAIGSAPLKQQLKNETEQALARGVFGSPFVLVDGEPFWGFDRFDQLRAHLQSAPAP